MIDAISHFETHVMSEDICARVVVVGWLFTLELLDAAMAWWASQVVPLAVGRGHFTICFNGLWNKLELWSFLLIEPASFLGYPDKIGVSPR